MEGEDGTTAKDAEASVDMEEIRQRRLAYFQTTQSEKASTINKTSSEKIGVPNLSEYTPVKKGNTSISAKTSEFHLTAKSSKPGGAKETHSIADLKTQPSSISPQDKLKMYHNSTELLTDIRRNTSSSAGDGYVKSAAPSHLKHDMSLTPSKSDKTPLLSNSHHDTDSARWAGTTHVRSMGQHRTSKVTGKSGDKEVEMLFSNKKSTSTIEIPNLSLKESVDIDSMSVFKSKADFEDLGLSTHRPESTTSSITNLGDRRQMARQRSISSESLLLGSKADEIRSLLGEQKYREFVQKSEYELNQLHQEGTSNWNEGNTPERYSRRDGSVGRSTPTPPPQPPSPHTVNASKRGPSPRRRLRSSSPQMVTRTLQDIASRSKTRDSTSSRNYEQVVVPHNVTFSADEIYRQAYGGDSSASSDLRKSSSSMASTYQESGTPFWNNFTPRQMSCGMTPTSPQSAPMLQPRFMPVSMSGQGHPTQPPPMSVGSPGTYFYPQTGGAMGQFGYSHPPNMYMPMSPGTSPQSPDSYFYHAHPLSQSMPRFHSPNSPMENPGALSWQYSHQGMGLGQDFQAQEAQTPVWNQFGARVPHNSQYGHSWHPPHSGQTHVQTPHPPIRAPGGDSDRSKGRSSAEHAEAVRHHHEQRRQEQERQSYASHNQTPSNFSASSLERYFASLGMPPPNYPPPSYPFHHPPPTHQPQPPPTPHQALTYPQQHVRPSDPQPLKESYDQDDMTTVTHTSWATGTSVKAGGITDRLEQMGIDPQVVQSIKQQRSDTVAADEEALEAMRNLVRICPECFAVNKEYMTWCLQCGGVLIGVDPVPAKELRKKTRDKKPGADSSSKPRKSSSKNKESFPVDIEQSVFQESSVLHPVTMETETVDVHHPIHVGLSVESQHLNTMEPVVKYEPEVEEEIVYSNSKKEDEPDSPSKVSEVTASPAREGEDIAVDRESVESKQSPESGRGASASSSPCRRNLSREVGEGVGEVSRSTLEVTDNKDSGRPSSGEGPDSKKTFSAAQLVPDNGPRRSAQEINDICEVISDPIIRGFIRNYLHKKPEDESPDLSLSQSKSNKHRTAAKPGSASERSGTLSNPKQITKAFSLDLGASMNSSSSVNAKFTSKKEVAPKKKVSKKGCKKGHEAIDVEIFALEEAKMLRSSQSGANVVPKLNLVRSSDEEDDSSEKTGSLQGVASLSHGASSDASSPRDDHAPVNYTNDIQTLASFKGHEENRTSQSAPVPQSGISQPNPEVANSNFLYLKDFVDNSQRSGTPPVRGRKPGPGRPHAQTRPAPVSRVRASIEAPPPNRRWMRSSIAWSSYHPRELSTRSTLNAQSGAVNGPGRQSSGNFRPSRSIDNLNNPSPPDMAPSQRARPASADLQSRKGVTRGRPSSAGQRPSSAGQQPHNTTYHPSTHPAALAVAGRLSGSGDQWCSEDSLPYNTVMSARSQETDVEGRPIHRLAVHDNTLPLIPTGPNAALKIYDRCFEMTPREELDQESKWLFLPDELWLHLFTYLPQAALYSVALTCKQLYRIALDPQLWKSITVRKKAVQDEWLREVSRRHPVSLAMVQCHGDQLSENTLRELFKEIAPKLKELNFSRCSKGKLIGDEILLHASTHCRHLTHVDASWCHVTDVGLTALAGCCHRLESLCLNGCQRITDESLKTVMEKHGTSLRVLELFGCFSLTPATFRNMAEYCTFLLTLNIGQCYKISDSNMVTLCASLSRVETLDLRGCKKLGDNSIRKIVRSCRRLRHLTLANCPLLSNAAIVEIATYSTDIRSLDICGCSNISDSSIQTLANNCFRLTSIDISSTSCTHRSVLMLAEASRNLESAKFNFLADIHDKSMAKLVKNCKRLNTVHLYGCNVRDVSSLKRYNRFLTVEM